MNLTRLSRLIFDPKASRHDSWVGFEAQVQRRQLLKLLRKGAVTDFGRRHGFDRILSSSSPETAYAEAVAPAGYEDFRHDIVRMLAGERDVLWPGRCIRFAQSSGTSGGRSKYVPVTDDSLRYNHYAGAADSVACYLMANPSSRLFAGKGFILGGSFASTLELRDPRVKVGDLSATLIDRAPALASLFRIPSKETALLSDWSLKLNALAREAAQCDVTNLSGVPSWFLKVLLKVMDLRGASEIREVWPNLEVFFHGGISFEPYRAEYGRICGPEALSPGVGEEGMHYFETYNASEGFFAVQYGAGPGRRPLRLLLDVGVYYEFLAPGADAPVGVADVKEGGIYELVITNCNGLWRYRLGDTVRIESVAPLLVTLAGRTRSFINAFGEELMECNAEQAMARAAERCGAMVANYTAAPVYAEGKRRGRHQWLIEWENKPADVIRFADTLDEELRKLNSDYDAKRTGTIFLDPPLITSAAPGFFDRWLQTFGSGRLGGQRKVPRLSNDRALIDSMLPLL